MDNEFSIRLIRSSDCNGTLEIYKPFVLSTAITFDYYTPSSEEFNDKIKTITTDYPWLVCLHGSRIIGYAYAGRHRQKTAYQWSAESTVYISPDFHGKGIGRILYESLFLMLKLQGYINVYAGIALPNEKSETFHKAMGFHEIGIYKNTGFKLGKWHDVKWFQLHLSEHPAHPSSPGSMKEIASSPDVRVILEIANKKLKHALTKNFNI